MLFSPFQSFFLYHPLDIFCLVIFPRLYLPAGFFFRFLIISWFFYLSGQSFIVAVSFAVFRVSQEVDTYEQNKSDFDSFSAIIRKYVGIKELTPAIVNEFIKKIIVHAPEKVDGKRVQKVDIVFNFVGEINFLSATQPKQ